MAFKVSFYSRGGTLKGKNMLPLGSIFFPLRVAPFLKRGFFLDMEFDSTLLIQLHDTGRST